MTTRICSETDCGKPHFARGYCQDHYTRWRMAHNPKRCEVAGCDRPLKGRGLCQRHYDAWKTSPQAVAERGQCSRPRCRKPRRSRGLCDDHYQEQRRANVIR